MEMTNHGCPGYTVTVDKAKKKNTGSSEDPTGVFRRVTLGEERFEDVESKGECLDSTNTGS